ncbi:hypothetical protein [Spiroplasma poulsonii]|uniref:hypothetical protein n=1 Tax=Spiroplasma poulsonii TaxID=2138 RepID=UPI001F4CF461|nr:hypothetical protein [Spiroplasma poulsonii]UNF62001.1 hypothetical protein MNU24_00615 [Spiroplasma poulsonii]
MIILMINYYYWCYWNLIQRPKKDKTILFLVKRKNTRSNTSNYRNSRNQKLLQQVFTSEKHDYVLFKESKKSQF